MPEINASRLLDNLDTLRSFGATGTGVVRPSLSDIDLSSRHWLSERFAEAGLSAEIDAVGTLLARSPNRGAGLLIGSHTDTQPTGGWLDGALGVVYGLEVAHTLLTHEATRHLSIDVASWIDEEGTYFACLGSKSFCGQVDDDDINAARSADGQSLRDALTRQGLDNQKRLHYSDFEHLAYLEAHIEQGPFLESTEKRIGVVTDIVGSRNIIIKFKGQQNHAGTTPMPLRRDALKALMNFAFQVNSDFPNHVGPRTVWTMGRIEVEPNAPSIIPGNATLHLQFRDPDEQVLNNLQERVLEWVRKSSNDDIVISAHPRTDQAVGVAMDSTLMQHLSTAAEQHARNNWVQMPSGAVHDAQVLASRMPAAMLFIPSIGGISHAFEEDSNRDDIVLGCQVMADAVAGYLLTESRSA